MITLLLLVRATYIMVLFFTQILFVVNHTINATPPERLQQHPLFTTNRTDRILFVWRLHPARPSHPGHSTILLRSEIPSGMCAKLCTAATSNNRDHASQSLLLLLARATHIYFCSSCTSHSWWITQSTQRHQRGCNSSQWGHTQVLKNGPSSMLGVNEWIQENSWQSLW